MKKFGVGAHLKIQICSYLTTLAWIVHVTTLELASCMLRATKPSWLSPQIFLATETWLLKQSLTRNFTYATRYAPTCPRRSSCPYADDIGVCVCVCRMLGTMVNCVVQDLAIFACRLPYSWLSWSAAQLQGSRCFSWVGCVWDHSYRLCRFPSSAPSWPPVDSRYGGPPCQCVAC